MTFRPRNLGTGNVCFVSYACDSLYKGLAIGISLLNRGSGWSQINLFHIFSEQSGTRTGACQVLQFLPVSYSTNASHLYFIPLPLIYIKLATDSTVKGKLFFLLVWPFIRKLKGGSFHSATTIHESEGTAPCIFKHSNGWSPPSM